jgi:hypothetical protein
MDLDPNNKPLDHQPNGLEVPGPIRPTELLGLVALFLLGILILAPGKVRAALNKVSSFWQLPGKPEPASANEHDRIVAIITFDRDPLVDASDADKHLFLNPLWRADR